MNRDGLTKMAKVEVVVTGAEASSVKETFSQNGARGFTSLSGVSGLGHDGYHQGKLLFNDDASLELLITVVPDSKVDALLAGLGALLSESSGVMFLTETWVSRPEYFQ